MAPAKNSVSPPATTASGLVSGFGSLSMYGRSSTTDPPKAAPALYPGWLTIRRVMPRLPPNPSADRSVSPQDSVPSAELPPVGFAAPSAPGATPGPDPTGDPDPHEHGGAFGGGASLSIMAIASAVFVPRT